MNTEGVDDWSEEVFQSVTDKSEYNCPFGWAESKTVILTQAGCWILGPDDLRVRVCCVRRLFDTCGRWARSSVADYYIALEMLRMSVDGRFDVGQTQDVDLVEQFL